MSSLLVPRTGIGKPRPKIDSLNQFCLITFSTSFSIPPIKKSNKNSNHKGCLLLELLAGIEPATSALPRLRSTYWAITAHVLNSNMRPIRYRPFLFKTKKFQSLIVLRHLLYFLLLFFLFFVLRYLLILQVCLVFLLLLHNFHLL